MENQRKPQSTPKENDKDSYLDVCNSISEIQSRQFEQSNSVLNSSIQDFNQSFLSSTLPFGRDIGEMDEDQRLSVFFEDLRNSQFGERRSLICQFVSQIQLKFLNESQFSSFKKILNRNLSKGAEYLNAKFQEKYENILYENYRKDFSFIEKTKIIMACIQYSEIFEKLPSEQRIKLNAPKILTSQYFQHKIEFFDELIDLVTSEDEKSIVNDIKELIEDIQKQGEENQSGLLKYMNEKSPQKDIKMHFEEYEGDQKTLLLELIIQYAEVLKVDSFFDYFYQQLKQIKGIQVIKIKNESDLQEEEKKQSQNEKNEQFSQQANTRTPATPQKPKSTPQHPNQFKQSYIEMLLDYQSYDEDNQESLLSIQQNFKRIFKLLQDQQASNSQIQNNNIVIQSCSDEIQDCMAFFIDDEQESFKQLIKNCVEELKIQDKFLNLFPGAIQQHQIQPQIQPKISSQPSETLKPTNLPSETVNADENLWYIEHMFELLFQNSEDTMYQFNQFIELEEFQNNKNFKNEFKLLSTKLNEADFIKKRLEDRYQIIYHKKDQNSYNKKEKEDFVNGYAIYIKIKQQLKKDQGDMLKKPIFDVKISSVASKIKSLKEFPVSIENHENLVSLIELLEDLIAFENQKIDRSSPEFSDAITYAQSYFNLIQGGDKIKINQLFNDIIQQIDLKDYFTVEEIQKIDTIQMPLEQIIQNNKIDELQFEQNPIQYIQTLVDDKSIKVPSNLEEKIESKYLSKLDAQNKKKLKNLFRDLKEPDELDLNDENIVSEIKMNIQDCFECLLAQDDQYELFELLFQYQKLKVPSLNIQKPISRDDRIKQDFKEVNEMLPLIGMKVSVQDFMKIYSQNQINSDKFEIVENFKNHSIIDGQKLLILLFDCIKNRNNFNQIISIFSEIQSDFKITKTLLFIYIYIHADQQLRTMLFTSCSQYMPIPMTAFNPWDIDYQTNFPRRIYFPEMVYTFEKHKSILQIKIQENINGKNIKSCSSIINKLFGKDFQTHLDSYINDGTIEIQFDYNCTKVFYLAVADAHGFLEEDILKKVATLFDCLIVHTDQEFSRNQKLNGLISHLNTHKKQTQKIFVIVHQKNLNKQFKFESVKKGINQYELMIPLFEDLQENNKTNFYNCCYGALDEFFINKTNLYIQNPKQRNQSRLQLLEFLRLFKGDEVDQIEQSIQVVEKLVEKIIFEDDLKSQTFLPMIYLAKLKSEYENILSKETELTDVQREEYRVKKEQNDEKMKLQKSSMIVKIFQEVIDNDIQLEILPVLTQIVKGYLQTVREPFETQLNQLRNSIGQQNDQQQKVVKQQLLDIKKEIDKKSFSQEMIIREIYYLSQYSSQKRQYDQVMRQLSKQLIRNGQPLELIDGDTLQFISNIYENIYSENDKEEVLVVSVIGVQSAGKSLLLNFLFGTQFHSSAGRCTKGVYSSILTYQCPNSGRNKKILLLDTEGIQSPDARDPTFDRKIVYYILSISHVILLCNKQEMNKDMGDILKLVAYELVNAKQQNIQSPDIYIILNMLAQLDSKIQNECVNKLQDEFIEINENKEQESVNETLKITIDNVIPLPFAFQTINFGPIQNNDKSKINTVNIPQLEFTNLIQQLRQRILNKFNEIESVKTSKMSLYQWFKFAEHIWDYTNQLRTLESFSNLQQKKQDKVLTDLINRLVDKHYNDSWNLTLKKFVDDHLKETLDSLAGGGDILFGNVQRQIQSRLEIKYEDVARQALQEYQRECKELNIQKQLWENKQKILEKKREHFMKKVFNYCANKAQKFIQEKSKNVGDSTLQQIIVKFLKLKNSYTDKEAIEIFEKEAWPDVLQKSSDVLQSKQEIIKRNLSNVSNEFTQVIKMRNEDKESFCNSNYMLNSNLLSLFNQIMIKFQNQQLILFEGDRKPVNYKKVLEFQRQEKKYLNKFPKQIFQEDQVFEYYKWKKALQEIVNISRLSHDIRIAVLDEYENNFLKSAGKFFNNVKNQVQIIFGSGNRDLTYDTIQRGYMNRNKVHEIIKRFSRELQKLGIEYTQDSSNFIPPEIFENEQRKHNGVNNTQQIIYLHIETMLSSNLYFKPYGLPIENPNESISLYGYKRQQNYEYLVFREFYCVDDYIQTSQMEVDQQDLFYNNKIRNIKVSSEMKAIVDAKFQVSIDQFLKFLSGSKKLKNFDHLAQKQTTQFFQNQLNWNQIINEIESCIVKNNSRIKGQNENLNFYIENLKKSDNQSINILKQFHLFESKCTLGVIRDVGKIIEDINGELNNFSLSISEEGMSIIYLLAQTAQAGLCYNLDLIGQIQPIKMLDERKEMEKKLFVGRLTMNNSMVDQGLGFKLINDYSKLAYEDCKTFIVDQFKEEIDQISEEFENINQVKQLEDYCINVQQKRIDYNSYVPNHEEQKEINDYIQLIVDPKKILEKKFEVKFLAASNNLIQSSISNFKQRFIDILENFQAFLTQFYLEISKKKIDKITAGVLFQLHDSSPLKLNDITDLDLQKYQKEALMRYFLEMISQTWNSNIIFKFQSERIWLKKNPQYNLPIFTDITIKFDEQNQAFIKQILKEDDQISNINVFIEEAIKTIKSVKKSLEINIDDGQIHEINPQDNDANKFMLNKQELLGQCYQKLRQKYIGCKEHCPMCRKQCDVAHNEHEEFKDQRHECQNGHQMQGFGGSKHFKDSFAVLKSCDEIRDQDNIKFNGDDIMWENFKLTKFPNWSFDSSNEAEVQKNREKNVKIWNLIGQNLCNIYNLPPQNINIIFKLATNEPEVVIMNISKIHYVIMLDDSGSMSGKPWQDLMNAFTIFLNKLLNDKILKNNSWITVINHNETSIVYFEEKQPNLSLIDLIKFRSGSNDFDNPLFDAHRICKKNPNKYDKFLLYFMSDGVCSFPQSGINRLIQDNTIINKIEFHSIAFGKYANKDILSRMANSFPNGKGIMSDAPNAQALAQTFIDIVPNIYA